VFFMVADTRKIAAYFSHLTTQLEVRKDLHCVAVAHMVPNSLQFLPALNGLVPLAAVLAKPKSVKRKEYGLLSSQFHLHPITRDWASNSNSVVEFLNERGLRKSSLIILDIGGYFASSIDDIVDKFEGRVLGVMEGTENGVQRYEKSAPSKTAVVTVARSPLKLPEDHLVASSIVYSIEAVLRDQAAILQSRTAALIGYGRVGSSVAELLRGRGINTVVYDKDPMKLALAAAKGFQAYKRLGDALASATLVVCATGNVALNLAGFGALRTGTVVASVTSSDDEFNLSCLSRGYLRSEVTPELIKYEENRPGGRHFYLVADGNAANFLHGAVIGPAIQLIEGEKLFAVNSIANDSVKYTPGKIAELSETSRRTVAEVWNEHFL
jgi:adenosylhomocysteinase